jgi:hypothetical protein
VPEADIEALRPHFESLAAEEDGEYDGWDAASWPIELL